MNKFDNIQPIPSIEESLASFTKRLDDSTSERFNELRKCSFFDPIPSDWLKTIATECEIRKFHAGEKLIAEGNASHSFFVILFGSTTVSSDNEVVGNIVSGECVGEGTFFVGGSGTRSATVVADDHVIVAEFNRLGIGRLQRDPTINAYLDKALLLALFKKLRDANRKIHDLLRLTSQLTK
jgi:CRP-like cAMP-binding protein